MALGRVRGREVSSVESPSSQLQETTPGRAATRLQGSLASSRLHRLRAAAINCSFAHMSSGSVIITCPARACIRGSAADLPASGSIRDAQVTAQSRRFWICSRTPDVDRCRRQTGMRKRLDKVPCCSCRTEHREPALRSTCSACIVCTHSTRCGDCKSRLQPDCARSCGLTDANISGVGGSSK